jgi:type IV secretion system protein VirB10
MADGNDKIRLDGEKSGPKVAKSNKSTNRYRKRIILVFLLGVAALLTLITAQAQFKINSTNSEQKDKNYRVPRADGFAELAAGMRRDRRPVQPPPVHVVVSGEPKAEPQKPPQRLVVRTAQRPAAPPEPRYYSNKDDAQAAATLRTLKMQALGAPPEVPGFKPENSEAGKGASQQGIIPPMSPGMGGIDPSVIESATAAIQQGQQPPDPNMQGKKMDFLRGSKGGGSLTPQEYSEYLPVQQQFPYELKAGTLIPGIMLTGINSDLPGNVMAQVSENVWDTATGRYVLIPKGTRILGVYDSQVAYGQKRILLVWNRLIYPNGTTLNIAGSPGVDQAGYSGMSGRVDNHWGTMIGTALLSSMFVAGAEILHPSDSNEGEKKSAGDVAAESVAGSIIQMGTNLMNKASNIQPTIRVRPGKRMRVFVEKDIVFPFPYF